MIMFNSSLKTTHHGALEEVDLPHPKGREGQRGHHTLQAALLSIWHMDSPFGMFGNYTFWNIHLLIKMCF